MDLSLVIEYCLHHAVYTCRYATARAEPPIDASQDISNTSASIQDGITTINFIRPLTSMDSNDLSLNVCRYFLYAYGGSVIYISGNLNIIGYHSSRGVISEMICLPSPAECPVPGKLLHGGLASSKQMPVIGNSKYHSLKYQAQKYFAILE